MLFRINTANELDEIKKLEIFRRAFLTIESLNKLSRPKTYEVPKFSHTTFARKRKKFLVNLVCIWRVNFHLTSPKPETVNLPKAMFRERLMCKVSCHREMKLITEVNWCLVWSCKRRKNSVGLCIETMPGSGRKWPVWYDATM